MEFMYQKSKITLTFLFVLLLAACAPSPYKEHSVCFFGSSVCRGEGADSLHGYAYLVGERLPKKWTYTNLSVNGNNTYDLLARFERDLGADSSRYVVIGLSLGNEGLHEHGEAALLSYRENMQRLIDMVRAAGKVPVVTNNYTRADFNEVDYQDLLEMNLEMQQWQVPTINLCGVIDDGHGRWAEGFWDGHDIYHPNTAGHVEMMSAFPPTLFEALAKGKPMPRRLTDYQTPKTDKMVSVEFAPQGTLHSYSLSCVIGDTTYTTVFSYARQLCREYRNAELISERRCTLPPKTFKVSGRNMRELMFYRSALSPLEVQALAEGQMLYSSLEVYATLTGPDKRKNLAQSLLKIKVRERRL